MLSFFTAELRQAIRRMRQSPIFVLTSVLVLGLGLGATIIISNVAYALFWRPLSFPQPERLLAIRSENAQGIPRSGAPITTGRAGLLADQVTSLAEIGLVASAPPLAVVMDHEVLDLAATRVNSGYLRALGLQPLAGRLFSEEDDRSAGGGERAVLSEKAWRKYFGADPEVVGQLLSYETDGRPNQFRVVGIVRGSATLPFAGEPDVLFSMPWRGESGQRNFGDAFYRCVLQTRPGMELERVSEEIERAFAVLDGEQAAGDGRTRYGVEPLRSALAPSNARAMLLMWGAACLLLILTCANLAGLILTRSIVRLQDAAVRLALGAQWWHLMLNSVAESGLLCLAGGLVAFGLNSLSKTWVPMIFPDLRRFGSEQLANSPMLVSFGVVLCVAVALVIGLPASLHVKQARIAGVLSQHGGNRVVGVNRWTLAMATAQLSAVLILLTTTGLVERSFLAALREDAGIKPEGAVTFRVSIPVPREALPGAASDLAGLVASIPGASRASFATEAPLGSNWATVMSAQGGRFAPDAPQIGIRLIGAGYFETLGARLAAGRTLSEEEIRRGDSSIVLNETAAKTLFAGSDPVGRVVYMGFLGLQSTVVGVVRDIRHMALDRAPGPMAYIPYRPVSSGSLVFVARADNIALLESVLKARVHAWHAGTLVRGFTELERTAAATVNDRFRSGLLIGAFAILGLVVSSFGLYGTVSNYVQKRRKEIALRMALGATPLRIVTMVLVEGARLIAAGLILGTIGSLLAGHLIRHLLYQVVPMDATSIAFAVVLLSAVAVCASLIPAVGASRMEPNSALKSI